MTISITKGKVSREDLKLWDGRVTRTFSRPTSTGGTATYTMIGDSVDVLTVYGNSTDQTDTSISAALARVKTPVCLDLAAGTWTINNNLTIPANVFVRFAPGALMNIQVGKTVTWSGGIIADKWQIFTGSGILTGTPQNSYIISKWYSDATSLTVSLSGIIFDNLGTSVTYDVGTETDEIPLTGDLGSAALYDVGTDEDAVPWNGFLGEGAFRDRATANDVFAGSDEHLVTPKYIPWEFGQCRFNYTNTTTCTLSRYNGTKLFVNGSWHNIPAAGVALGTGGLSASTFYYVYALITSAAIALEAVATAPAIDATYGHQIKTGDATRTLVGMVYMNGSTQYDLHMVRSWYNDQGSINKTTFSTDRTSTNTTYPGTEINTEIRNDFISWSGEGVQAFVVGSASHGSARISTAVGFDGTVDDTLGSMVFTNGTAQDQNIAIFGEVVTLSEGYHYASLYGANSSGTATWFGTTTDDNGRKTYLTIKCTGRK